MPSLELGQAIFGQPVQEYDCPLPIIALLEGIDSELDRVMWNNTQEDYPSPFSNTGNKFKNDTFEVEAYSWDDDRQEYNFKYKDIQISWYKYLGRGTTINREVTPAEAFEMYEDCISSIKSLET